MAQKKKYWYPTAFSCWGDEERAAIDRVMASGQFTMGEEVYAFEREFAQFHDKDYAIMVNSGSSANLIMLAALCQHPDDRLRLMPGSTVLVPALAWSTTYAPLVQHGLRIRLLDVDETWNVNALNSDRYRSNKTTHGVDLVIGCSILGNPARLGDLRRETYRFMETPWFIEDNCESFGAMMDGDYCGTFGDMASFSLFYSHQLSAIEGGVILTDDPVLAEMCVKLRAHGWDRELTKPRSFEEEYNFTCFGYNLRPLELHAAIAREQLKKQEAFAITRRRNNALFRAMVSEIPGVVIQKQIEASNPFGLSFTVPVAKRTALVQALRAFDIDCRMPTGGSFTRHPYGEFYRDQPTPNADNIHDCGLFLGNGPLDLNEQITKAVDIIKGVLARHD